jgi:hypothetical protein
LKKLAPILPLFAAAGIVAAIAVAGPSNIPSSVSIDTGATLATTTSPSRNFFIGGHVESAKAKCLPKRTVKIRAFYGTDTTPQPFDTARTGTHGGYNGIGPSKHGVDNIEAAKAILKPKKVGAKTCSGDTAGDG